MCERGDTVQVRVPYWGPDYNKRMTWKYQPIDRCLADTIKTLNRHGIFTVSCCCGHGKGEGSILLALPLLSKYDPSGRRDTELLTKKEGMEVAKLLEDQR